MNTGSIVALIVVLVAAVLAWMFLKDRRRDDPAAVPPPAVDIVEAPPEVAVALVEVASPPTAPAVSAPAPLTPVPRTPPPVVPSAAPAPAAAPQARPVPPPPPPDSVTVIMAKPRPPVPVVERVLALEKVDEGEWEAALPLALSAVQGAAVATAMAAVAQPRPGDATVHAVRFDAGAAIRIARGDVETLRAIAAASARAAPGKGRWLDSAAATALAATALAALASERWLDDLGDEMRDLKVALAALSPRVAALGDGRLKALAQDLSRFAREARDNYVSVIGKLAFRERVADGCERAASVWHEVVASSDAARQQLELIIGSPRFGEGQVERSLAHWRELQEQERLQEIAARVLAAMHTLRLALGDAASATAMSPLASAMAALQSGAEQDRELSARLLARERDAKGDPYVGRAEFEANRAALRKLLDRPPAESMALAMQKLATAAATEPLDADAGAASRLLVMSPPGVNAGSLRWSSAPRAG